MDELENLQNAIRQVLDKEAPTETDYERAVEILDNYGEDRLPLHWLVKKYIFIRNSSFESKYNFENSIKCLERALKIQPNHWEVLLELAHYYDIQGESKKARDFFEKAVHQTIEIALEVFFDYGEYIQDEIDEDNAIFALNEIKKKIFESPELQLIYQRKGRLDT